jgi:hypothetical protein
MPRKREGQDQDQAATLQAAALLHAPCTPGMLPPGVDAMGSAEGRQLRGAQQFCRSYLILPRMRAQKVRLQEVAQALPSAQLRATPPTAAPMPLVPLVPLPVPLVPLVPLPRLVVTGRPALEAARELLLRKPTSPGALARPPLVLLPADPVNPGTGDHEAPLFRTTALASVLTHDLYPLGREDALYAPAVPVLSGAERTGEELAFLALDGGNPDLGAVAMLALGTAWRLGHSQVVLGFGGGACPRRAAAAVVEVLGRHAVVAAALSDVVFAVRPEDEAAYRDALGCPQALI